MKYTLLICITFIFNKILISQVYVNGYYKSNGTYVSPHYRSFPDDSKYNNYSNNQRAKSSYPSNSYTNLSIPINSSFSNIYSEAEIKAEIDRTIKREESEKKYFEEKIKKNELELPNNYFAELASKAYSDLRMNNLAAIEHINNMSYEDLISWHLRYTKENRIFLEKSLNLLGFDIGTNDGFFDYYTIKGIKSFQIANDLEIDGKIGQKMINRIKYLMSKK